MTTPVALRVFAGLAALCVLTACRQDMHNQPRYKPLAASSFFGDGLSARMTVDGTVAWGRSSIQPADREFLRLDTARYTGKVNDTPVDYFPFPITKADLDRGQERYNVYCSPCHSRIGDGNGMVVRRGFKQAASYHTDRLINAPVGHFFDVITNGFGYMPSYASRVEPDDRWRIVAYVRALQLSQNAQIDAVPADRRGDLDKNLPSPKAIETQLPPQEPRQ